MQNLKLTFAFTILFGFLIVCIFNSFKEDPNENFYGLECSDQAGMYPMVDNSLYPVDSIICPYWRIADSLYFEVEPGDMRYTDTWCEIACDSVIPMFPGHTCNSDDKGITHSK